MTILVSFKMLSIAGCHQHTSYNLCRRMKLYPQGVKVVYKWRFTITLVPFFRRGGVVIRASAEFFFLGTRLLAESVKSGDLGVWSGLNSAMHDFNYTTRSAACVLFR